MNKLIVGLDAGNDCAKIVGAYGVDTFKTNICDWFERNIEETFGDDDMEFEINGRKGFAGSIAAYEGDYGNGKRYGDSKAHEDTLVRVLLGVYRYTTKYCPHINRISLVTGQPIAMCNKAEKEAIKTMLEGIHDITVNGRKQTYYIEGVGVAPEGSGAFWVAPRMGVVRVLDIGSGTVNAATMADKRHVHNGSTTYNFGMDTIKNKTDYDGIARGIVQNTTALKWQRNDIVYVCGGVAEELLPFLRKHYVNSVLLEPQVSSATLRPVYANAYGFYDIARRAFR